MSRNGDSTLDFADDTYTFRLAWKQLIELQEKRDAGPIEILSRLQSGLWLVQDISEVIRIGLIGGGMEPKKALKLVRDYVEDRPPMENLATATLILIFALKGSDEDKPKEQTEANQTGPPGNGSTTFPIADSATQ